MSKKLKIIIPIIVLLLIGSYFGFNSYQQAKHRKAIISLGYEKDTANLIIDNKIDDYILDTNIYSATLEKALLTDKYINTNFEIYISFEDNDSEALVDKINSLSEIGYQSTTIIKAFQQGYSDVLVSRGYAKILETAITEEKFNANYIDIYLNCAIDKENILDTLNAFGNKGYVHTEVKTILEKFDDTQITKILELGYIKDIVTLSQTNHFDFNLLERYVAYRSKTGYTIQKVVDLVGMGVDKDFYTNIQAASNPDSTTVLVSKYFALSSSFVPSDLVNIPTECAISNMQISNKAYNDFMRLCNAASQSGNPIIVKSGYRSYQTQDSLYKDSVANNGVYTADRGSARAGHSEHQTGLAIDIYSKNQPGVSFQNTAASTWIINNAYQYGFIVRYTNNNNVITGYMSEPWHLRYVGVEVATYMKTNNVQSYEEYYYYHK